MSAGKKKKVSKKKQLGSRTQKAKKKWFIVNASEQFNKKEIGEIPANEPKALIGRTVETSFGQISGNRRDVFNKIVIKINKVQGETADTEAKKFFVADSYIQSLHRRKKQRILCVFNVKTKDEKELKFKIYLLGKNKIHHSVSSKLQKVTKEYVSAYAKKATSADILSIEGPKKISNLLKTNLKKIYPCSAVVWKIYNLNA